MERLDHLPRLIDEDTYFGSHALQQDKEDYDWLTRWGATHEQALERIGLTHRAWVQREYREKHGSVGVRSGADQGDVPVSPMRNGRSGVAPPPEQASA